MLHARTLWTITITVAVVAAVILTVDVLPGLVTARAGGVAVSDLRPEPVPSQPTDDPASPSPTPSSPDDPTPGPAEKPSSEPTDASTDPPAPETEEPEPDPGPDIAAVQQRLQDLHYYLGSIDGEQGPATTNAVMAFQKVNGLTVDGVVGRQTLAALDDPVNPALRDGPATRIEVDLTRQVVHLVRDGELVRTMPASSGNGETYTSSSGGTARALTPVGWFEIERRIVGVRRAPLGILYDPLYFHRGWALHGSDSVPAHPASHGCVRLPRADARWLADQVPDGTAVHLYGGAHVFEAGDPAPGTDAPAGD